MPDYLRAGIVVEVRPNTHGIEWLTEYLIRFNQRDALFYQSQLRLERQWESIYPVDPNHPDKNV